MSRANYHAIDDSNNNEVGDEDIEISQRISDSCSRCCDAFFAGFWRCVREACLFAWHQLANCCSCFSHCLRKLWHLGWLLLIRPIVYGLLLPSIRCVPDMIRGSFWWVVLLMDAFACCNTRGGCSVCCVPSVAGRVGGACVLFRKAALRTSRVSCFERLQIGLALALGAFCAVYFALQAWIVTSALLTHTRYCFHAWPFSGRALSVCADGNEYDENNSYVFSGTVSYNKFFVRPHNNDEFSAASSGIAASSSPSSSHVSSYAAFPTMLLSNLAASVSSVATSYSWWQITILIVACYLDATFGWLLGKEGILQWLPAGCTKFWDQIEHDAARRHTRELAHLSMDDARIAHAAWLQSIAQRRIVCGQTIYVTDVASRTIEAVLRLPSVTARLPWNVAMQATLIKSWYYSNTCIQSMRDQSCCCCECCYDCMYRMRARRVNLVRWWRRNRSDNSNGDIGAPGSGGIGGDGYAHDGNVSTNNNDVGGDAKIDIMKQEIGLQDRENKEKKGAAQDDNSNSIQTPILGLSPSSPTPSVALRSYSSISSEEDEYAKVLLLRAGKFNALQRYVARKYNGNNSADVGHRAADGRQDQQRQPQYHHDPLLMKEMVDHYLNDVTLFHSTGRITDPLDGLDVRAEPNWLNLATRNQRVRELLSLYAHEGLPVEVIAREYDRLLFSLRTHI